MGMKAPKQSSNLLAPAGVFPARLCRVIEIGEHETRYKGETKTKDQVFLFYNLVTKMIEDESSELKGKQYQVRTRPLTNSTSRKAALWDHRKIINPDSTSYKDLLNAPVFLTTVHNEVEVEGDKNTYCNIMNVSGVPEGIPVPELDLDVFHFDFDNPDPDIWQFQLWDWMREKIMGAENYEGSAVQEMVLRLKAMDEVQGESE